MTEIKLYQTIVIDSSTTQVTRDVKRRFDSSVSSRPTTRSTADPDDDDDDDNDNDSDDDREFSFWPSEEEFKDLLLDESRMRVEIVGDWMTPYGLWMTGYIRLLAENVCV